MKSKKPLFIFLFLITIQIQAQVFVKSDATGNNDGTTWADAFTNLQDALTSANAGDQFWIAAGTYVPGNPGDLDSVTFLLNKNLEIYGGFAGTETQLSERDFENNLTVLSGDLNGDDIENDFSMNRSDNVLNVMRIDNTISTETIIDGLIFQGGHADGDEITLFQVRGAGVFSTGAAQFKNCLFHQNYAENSGGGICFRDVSSSGGKVENCRFENNKGNFAGAGVYFSHTSGTVESSIFNNNIGDVSAGGILFYSDIPNQSVEIRSSTFENNESTTGGAITFRTESNENHINIIDCEFINNQVTGITSGFDVFGGAIFNLFQPSSSNSTATIDSCSFLNNTSTDIAGAITNLMHGENDSYEIKNSSFSNNIASRLGGAISTYAPTDSSDSKITHSTFENNESTFGGAIHWETEGENNHNLIEGCEFNNNKALEITTGLSPGGGAIHNFFDPISQNSSAQVKDCIFMGNSSEGVGGAIQDDVNGSNQNIQVLNTEFFNNSAIDWGGGYRAQSQDINLHITFDDCLFDGNQAFEGGGLVVAQFNDAHTQLEIQNTDFFSNISENASGGSYFYSEDNSPAEIQILECRFEGNMNTGMTNPTVKSGGFGILNFGQGIITANIQSSIFKNNTSEVGTGGLVFFNDRNIFSSIKDVITIQNCLIAENEGGGFGGGIQINASADVFVKESTVADNVNGGLRTDKGDFYLQNTILQNPGFSNFISSTSSISSTSLGGNLVSDVSMNQILNGTDIENQDPLFVGSGDYQLTNNSPAIDKGILPNDVPDFDLAGNDRVNGCIDIGAFESPFTNNEACVTDVEELLIDEDLVSVFPNPVTDVLNFSLENEWQENLTLRIVNTLGQTVLQQNISKNQNKEKWEIDMSKIPTGSYQLMLSNDEYLIVKSIVKI